MKDSECVQFLQWALPHLRMRWPGFRKVRRQVCKRVGRRIRELQLPSVAGYRSYLVEHPAEWNLFDRMCRITISRFYRDKQIFAHLERQVLPELARTALAGTTGTVEQTVLSCWCVGCASGEEPYTLAMMWELSLRKQFSALDYRIVATDVDHDLLARAERAVYSASVLKDLPSEWREMAFNAEGEKFRLHPDYQQKVEFAYNDIRSEAIAGSYHLVLCRNLAFTYFAEDLQQEVLQHFGRALLPGGILVIGVHETLPAGQAGWSARPDLPCCYRKEG